MKKQSEISQALTLYRKVLFWEYSEREIQSLPTEFVIPRVTRYGSLHDVVRLFSIYEPDQILDTLNHDKELDHKEKLFLKNLYNLAVGHRASVDADFFSDGNDQPVPELLKYVFPSIITNIAKVEPKHGCMGSKANGIKIDIFDYDDPFVKEAIVGDGIRLVSLIDIGLMKLDVQNRRNALKDLIDLNAITDIHPLSELLSFYNKRYPALPLKQAVMLLIQNIDSPPALATFPSDLMFMETNPNNVVLSLKAKWADLYKLLSKAFNDGTENSNEQKPKGGIGY